MTGRKKDRHPASSRNDPIRDLVLLSLLTLSKDRDAGSVSGMTGRSKDRENGD